MSRTIYIYTLADPRDGKIRYVGKTVNMLTRFRQHCYRQKNTHLKCWITQLQRERLSPIMEEIERCESGDENQWQEAEKFWINNLRFLGFNLINLKEGGIGSGAMPDEIKQKIAKAMKGRKPSPYTLARVLESRKTFKLSKHHLECLRKANTGRRPTQIQLEARGKIWRGKKLSPEHCEKLKLAWIARKARGNVFPQEVRDKLKAAVAKRRAMGWPEPPEAHAKHVAAGKKGQQVSYRNRLNRESLLQETLPL